MQRLHIHFGIHRTGTTSIHRNLYNNFSTLRKMGIYYPDIGMKHRHVQLAWQLINKSEYPKQILKLLINEVPRDVKLIILSSEDFSRMENLEWIKLFANEYEISVSIYLKRQDLWLESWYNQHIKWPWDKRLSNVTPDIFLQNLEEFYWINFEHLLARITSAIPRERLYVNVIDSAGIKDTTNDFFHHCGIDVNLLEQTKIENESLTAVKLQIVRYINLIDIKQKSRDKLLTLLNKMNIKEDDGSKIVFNDEQVKFILDKFHLSNQSVAKDYFGRNELFTDPVKLNRNPILISESICQTYILRLLKELSNSCS